MGTQYREDEVAECLLEVGALGPLVVHGDPVGHEGGHGGGPLVGQHDGVATVEDGRHEAAAADDRGDGHVPVEEAELGGAPDQGVDGAQERLPRAAR